MTAYRCWVSVSLKALIASEHRKWLDIDNNSDRWFGNEQPYSAKERRILTTHWAGDDCMIAQPNMISRDINVGQ